MTETTDIDVLRRDFENLRRLVTEGLMIQQGAQIGHLFQNHAGHMATNLTALSFLVEKCGVTIDDISNRFDVICKTRGDNYSTSVVATIKDLVIDALRTAYPVPTAAKPAPTWTPQIIKGGA